jgi:spore maturation protein SpmB
MKQHHHHNVALSAALAAGILYTIVALLLKYVPDTIAKLLAAVHMTSVETFVSSTDITLGSYALGLVGVFVGVYLLVCLAGCIHHRLAKHK